MLEPRQRVGASQTPRYAFHPTWVVWGDEIPLLSRGMPGMGGPADSPLPRGRGLCPLVLGRGCSREGGWGDPGHTGPFAESHAGSRPALAAEERVPA